MTSHTSFQRAKSFLRKLTVAQLLKSFATLCFILDNSLPCSHRLTISSSMDPYTVGTYATIHFSQIKFIHKTHPIPVLFALSFKFVNRIIKTLYYPTDAQIYNS